MSASETHRAGPGPNGSPRIRDRPFFPGVLLARRGRQRWIEREITETKAPVPTNRWVSPPLNPSYALIEYEAVMTRREHLTAAALSAGDVGVLLDAVAAVAERVELAFLWRPISPDADDDMVMETAVNGRADGIVTFNWRDFEAARTQFGLAILSPAEAVTGLGPDE